MAFVSGTTTALGKGVVRHLWTLTSLATIGRPFTGVQYPDKTLTIQGTFSNANVTIIGSNQSATVANASLLGTGHAINDTRGEGNPLTFTAANTVAILENPNLIYPKIVSLGATTGGAKSLNITIVAQSTKR